MKRYRVEFDIRGNLELGAPHSGVVATVTIRCLANTPGEAGAIAGLIAAGVMCEPVEFIFCVEEEDGG